MNHLGYKTSLHIPLLIAATLLVQLFAAHPAMANDGVNEAAEPASPLDIDWINPPLQEAIAQQSTEDVVKDVANVWEFVEAHRNNNIYSPGNMNMWSAHLLDSRKVRRLIQEGREKPDFIKPLLIAELNNSMAAYPQVSADYRKIWEQIFTGEAHPQSLSSKDEYYDQNRKYAQPTNEIQRLHMMVYSCFYILANMDALDQNTEDLLRRWMTLDKPRSVSCPDMDRWVMERHMKASYAAGSEKATQFMAHTRGQSITGKMRRVFAWDEKASLGIGMQGVTRETAEAQRKIARTILLLDVPESVEPIEK